MNPRTLGILLAISTTIGFSASAQIYDTNDDVTEAFAGSGTTGFLNGQGTVADFSDPGAVAADSYGNLYVTDTGNQVIRLITTNGTVSTFVGGGTANPPGFGTSVRLSGPLSSMVCDHSNTLWVVETGGLLQIANNGLVQALSYSGIYYNSGLCVDSSNNLYYSGLTQIYRLGANGTLGVFAGSANSGSADGKGIFASFSSPGALACDEAGNIYVWDSGNHLIRRIDQNQNVTTIAGNNTIASVDGVGLTASFSFVGAMQADGYGNIFLACGSSIRKIDASTNVWTVAGSFNQNSYANGAGAIARFNDATGICLSEGMIFVADSGNQRIRSISFNPIAQQVAAPNLSIAAYAGVTITGFVGRTYQIQSSTDMANWSAAATVLLTSSPYLWYDTSSVAGSKFYRAFLMP